jgi:uncharacterized membrane protein
VRDGFLFASAFLASAVEMVEALTIVLASGLARGWRSSLAGLGAATVALAVIVGALGPALTLVPLSALRLVVGGLLLAFGLQWLRKAILRASGVKALRDESREFEEMEAAATAAAGLRDGLDAYSFTIAFKGVLLEGLEVVFIVLTFGANQHRVGLAALAAVLAASVVIATGLLVHRPLSRVPENAMKFAVGVMLTSFGVFWGAEGAGATWPGGDAALLATVPSVLAVSLGLVLAVRHLSPRLHDQLEGPGGLPVGP